MTYKLTPGTAAYRIVSWLEAQGRTKEFNSSQIGYALHLDTKGLPAQLESALQAGLVFRRQKDSSSPRAPFWYSLTDHGATHRREFRTSPKEWLKINRKDAEESGSSPGTPGTAGTPAGTCASSAEAAAADAPSGDEGAAADADRAAAPAPDTSEGLASQQVLKAEAARPDATAREATSTGSPGVGPMGAWQPADAGPTTDVPVFITEQRREVDEQFAASLRAAMSVDVDDDCLARGAELGRRQDRLPSADLAATRRAVHAPHEPAPLAFRAARFSDGSLATERDGVVVAVYSAAEVDAIQKLLGVRG